MDEDGNGCSLDRNNWEKRFDENIQGGTTLHQVKDQNVPF
jgi:hypothetical protein